MHPRHHLAALALLGLSACPARPPSAPASPAQSGPHGAPCTVSLDCGLEGLCEAGACRPCKPGECTNCVGWAGCHVDANCPEGHICILDFKTHGECTECVPNGLESRDPNGDRAAPTTNAPTSSSTSTDETPRIISN